MSNTLSTLLSNEERRSLYDPPSLNDAERTEFFTFSDAEVTMIHSFNRIDYAIYFAISLAFFKLKYTLVKFQYRNVTVERQHVMQRYFPNQISPRSFPDEKDAIVRIENKVLAVVQFSRFRKSTAAKILSTLQSNASSYPRQRQLCKAMLNLLIKEKVAVPSFTTLQDCVSQIWNDEQARILKAYYRYTTQAQRERIISLLDKTDDHHRIVSIKKDMKEFNTESIHEELEKHTMLKAVFLIAKNVLPKLQLPDATINYYADLINYYNGTRLKQLNLDISIVRNDELSNVVILMKEHLANDKTAQLPKSLIPWITKDDLPYIVKDNEIISNRFEFLLYKNLSHHIATNKLILKFSIKHKEVEDNFIALPKWQKEKSKLLKSQPYSKLQLKSPASLLDEKEQALKLLYEKVNYDIKNGNNKEIILKPNEQKNIEWRLSPLKKTVEPNDSLFLHFPKKSIVEVMRFVDNKTLYSKAMESVLPRSIKTEKNPEATDAVILSNPIRMGSRAMASVCDFNLNQLLLAENELVRMETVVAATHIINLKAQELEIFKHYNIGGVNHLSLDGLKVASRIQNIKARHSPKFLGNDPGVSSYNAIFNHFPINGKLIGSNEYEGNFTFEMVHHQNLLNFKIERASTDRHGKNPFNFAWFDLTDSDYAPRLPKPHREILWGLGKHNEYEDLIINPHNIANKNYIIDEWDNMQRMMISMLTGIAVPSVVVAKMSPNKYRSKTKLAFMHYNHIVRSEFILRTIDDKNVAL